MTVTAPELNVRAGPGENYSVVGTITQGTQVREVLTDGHWMRIAAPPGTYAFVAAMYLQQEAPATSTPPVAAKATIEMPQPETNPTIPTNEVPANEAAATTADATAAVAVAATTNAESAATSAADMMTVGSPTLLPAEPSSVTQPPPVSEPPPPRVVTHEGVVKTTVSIQAPTPYALVNPETGRTVNYLLSPTTNLDLGLYKGLRIVVNGEEGLDSRWTNTPVITIKRIHVVE